MTSSIPTKTTVSYAGVLLEGPLPQEKTVSGTWGGRVWPQGEEAVTWSQFLLDKAKGNWSVQAVSKFSKTNPCLTSGRFFSDGVTPLFLCLVSIEVCDAIFASDSMPVIVDVVRDP
ncbi:MAG: hypothetical protein WCK17_04400 [Verrucomicrobiota bacterium]